MTRRTPLHPRLSLTLGTVLTAGLLTACGTEPQSPAASDEPARESADREVASVSPRALLAHEGGLTLIDTESGEVVEETPHDGFVRLSPAGDGRHVAIADSDTFRLYDAGIRSERHGDHDHHREGRAGLTSTTYDAPEAGHVVPHAGWTALFSDGTGEFQLVESGSVADPDATVTTESSGEAHHGVAARLGDGTLLHTEGTSEERRSVVLRDGTSEIARTDECPGVHGEAFAAPTATGDVAVLGCEDGPVVLRDGAFHKVEVDQPYVRNGNLAGHPGSPIVLADHKVNPDAELERPTRVSLVDTRDATLRTVDLGSSYWFRSLARGGDGEALVLTYDGSVRILDPESGEQTASVAAIAPWREKSDWQLPGPVLTASGNRAYVSDAARRELVVVDLDRGRVIARHATPAGVTEMVVVTGSAPDHEEPAGHEGDDHEDHKEHDHAGHDH